MKPGVSLYRNMLNQQKAYRDAYVDLNKGILEFFKPFCNEENSRIKVDEYNFVVVRVAEDLPTEVVKKFQNDFGIKLMWEHKETIRDYRNVEGNETDATVYEYGFGPSAYFNQNGDEDEQE